MASYEVQYGRRPRRFATEGEARKWATEIGRKAGVVVGIVSSPRKPTHEWIGDPKDV